MTLKFVRRWLLPCLLASLALPALARDGAFDYWVLSLSWSPEYCSTEGRHDTEQCGRRHYAFVVHGLWPQNERGFPEHCATRERVPEAVIARMLPIMPSRDLIVHEWRRHGACSGLSASDYFALVNQSYGALHIPDAYRNPSAAIRQWPEAIRNAFSAANPGLTAPSMVARCGGSYLRELRICYDRNLRPRPCGADLKDNCTRGPVILRPVR